MSIIKNSYGKWLHVTLKLYSDEADSITRRSHCDARLHRNNLLMEHIQENESNAYTKITDNHKKPCRITRNLDIHHNQLISV